MNKSDIIRKLTSRKLWLAVVGFVTALLAAFGASESTTTQVAGIIMAGATVVGYIVGEGLADAARARSTHDDTQSTAYPNNVQKDQNDTDDTDESESTDFVIPPEYAEMIGNIEDALTPVITDIQEMITEMVKAITPAIQKTSENITQMLDDMQTYLDVRGNENDDTQEV